MWLCCGRKHDPASISSDRSAKGLQDEGAGHKASGRQWKTQCFIGPRTQAHHQILPCRAIPSKHNKRHVSSPQVMVHRCENTHPHIRLRGLHNSLTYQIARRTVSVDLGIWNRAYRRSEDLGQRVARPREARSRSGHDARHTSGDRNTLVDGR